MAPRSGFAINPPWVGEVLQQSLDDMQRAVPRQWLPEIRQRGDTIEVKEYGCGFYGCVVPTSDPRVVLKLTTDDTEAEFAATFAAELVAPICVKYHHAIRTRARHNDRVVWLLWRTAAEHVGDMREHLGVAAVRSVQTQHDAGAHAFSAARQHPQVLRRFAAEWVRTCEAMARQPGLEPLGDGLIRVWTQQHILFGDLGEANLGMVDGQWVITDPGHVAVVDPSVLTAASPEDTDTGPMPDDLLLIATRYGLPSHRAFLIRTAADLHARVVTRDEAENELRDALPSGFRIGSHLHTHRDFALARGVPGPFQIRDNALYVARPSEIARRGVFGHGPPARPPTDREAEPVRIHVDTKEEMFVDDLTEPTLWLAAADGDRPIAVQFLSMPPGWRPYGAPEDISDHLLSV